MEFLRSLMEFAWFAIVILFDPIRISNCCSMWVSLFLFKGTNLDVQWMSVDVQLQILRSSIQNSADQTKTSKYSSGDPLDLH